MATAPTTIKVGGYDITPDWMVANVQLPNDNIGDGSTTRYRVYYNPNDPTQNVSYLGTAPPAYLEEFLSKKGNFEGSIDPAVVNRNSLVSGQNDKILASITGQGSVSTSTPASGTTATSRYVSPTPVTSTQVSSTGTAPATSTTQKNIDYTFHVGQETIEQYNARIAAARGETAPTGSSTSGAPAVDARTQAINYLKSIGYSNPDEGEIAGVIGRFQSSNGASGSSSSGTIAGGNTSTSTNPGAGTTTSYDTGNPELNALLGQMQTYLQTIIASGKQINPNIELEPKLIQQFLDQATSEIDPYYASQIKNIKDQLQPNLDLIQRQYENEKMNSEATFKKSIADSRESAAGAGTVFSGQRILGEKNYLDQTNRGLDLNAAQYQNQVNNTLRNTAGQVGSRNLSNLNTPSFATAAGTLEGNGSFYNTGRTYNALVPSGITGSLEQDKLTAIRSRQNQLETAARQDRALSFYS